MVGPTSSVSWKEEGQSAHPSFFMILCESLVKSSGAVVPPTYPQEGGGNTPRLR